MKAAAQARVLARVAVWLAVGLVLGAGRDAAALAGGGAVQPPSSEQKWALWTDGTRLRGANIYQRRVYPQIDEDVKRLGPDPVGPPYTRADIEWLAALGANTLFISHPGLFSETGPPYRLDAGVQSNLDRLLDFAADAGLFAVISFRTGPGRSEFAILRAGAGEWFPAEWMKTADAVWTNRAAQDGWVEMWRYAARRYRSRPTVVGYNLMVEPNATTAVGRMYNPRAYHTLYADTVCDWNIFHKRMTAAIRRVDRKTPVLIEAEGWASPDWLPWLKPNGLARTVYVVHQYAPFRYTHQGPLARCAYPGWCVMEEDGLTNRWIDAAWLSDRVAGLAAYRDKHGVPVAVTEFGVARWAPGAARFLCDQIEAFEKAGINHGVWMWSPSWPPWAAEDKFNFMHGTNAEAHADALGNELLRVLAEYWVENAPRKLRAP